MNHRFLLLLCVSALTFFPLPIARPVAAQEAGGRTPEQIKASYDAHNTDFDYLLGDWEFDAVSLDYGEGRGYWSAVRLAEGAEILDEYRVVGDDGETYYASSTLRAYNAVLDRWELVSVERGTGLQNVGTGRRVGDEMHLEQTFNAAAGEPILWRIRYYDIQPDRFSWIADISHDDGKTWVEGHMRIEARRIGPPRTLDPLTPAKSDPSAGTKP